MVIQWAYTSLRGFFVSVKSAMRTKFQNSMVESWEITKNVFVYFPVLVILGNRNITAKGKGHHALVYRKYTTLNCARDL